jgi:Zn-dependent protease with chaperone function
VTAAAAPLSFWDELDRRRRGGWIWSAVSALVSAGLGVMLSALVTPLILLAAGGLLHLGEALGMDAHLARAAESGIRLWARGGLDAYERLVDALDHVHGWRDRALVLAPLARLAPMTLPALAAGAVVWWVLRATFLRGRPADLAQRLGARDPNPADAEEHQLGNLVEEMAIAAGAPAPRLFMIDSPLLNAAAVGRAAREGAVVVTRGLVDNLDRAETQAVVGRLVAGIGAGDIRVAQSILAVTRTFGFFLTVLDLSLRLAAWRTLFDLAVAVLSPRPSVDRLNRAADGLEASLDASSTPDLQKYMDRPVFRGPLAVIWLPVLPLMLISMLYKLVLFLWTAFFLGPPLALMWRSRCYWSDAAAVRLARDPETLAGALQKMADSGVPPGAEPLAYLFVGAAGAAASQARDRRQISVALNPPIGQRVARLRAMAGAVPGGHAPAWLNLSEIARRPLAALATAVLLLLLVPLGLTLLLLIGFLTMVVMSISLAAGLSLVAGLV